MRREWEWSGGSGGRLAVLVSLKHNVLVPVRHFEHRSALGTQRRMRRQRLVLLVLVASLLGVLDHQAKDDHDAHNGNLGVRRRSMKQKAQFKSEHWTK